ncbi:MAG: flavodoxin family protein [Chloroflexi bacterium]|nr:flavodoxin family protein [Chloroflexota bacterium]
MQITLLNGALNENDPTHAVADLILAELDESPASVIYYPLHTIPIATCIGCFECWVKSPGECRISDAGRDIARDMIQSDVVLMLSPIPFGTYSSELKKVLDRAISLILPFFQMVDGEVHHQPRYERYPSLIGIGVLPTPNASLADLFDRLVGRHSINMHAPSHATLVVTLDQSEQDQQNALRSVLSQLEGVK